MSAPKKICFTPTGLLLYSMVIVILAYVAQAFIYAANKGIPM